MKKRWNFIISLARYFKWLQVTFPKGPINMSLIYARQTRQQH